MGVSVKAVSLPFVPIIVGVILKLTLVDDFARDAAWIHFEENYVRSFWLEFVVAAYIAGVIFVLAKREANGGFDTDAVISLFIFPAIGFIVCLALANGLPKVGVEDPIWIVWIPDAVGAFSLALSGTFIEKLQT